MVIRLQNDNLPVVFDKILLRLTMKKILLIMSVFLIGFAVQAQEKSLIQTAYNAIMNKDYDLAMKNYSEAIKVNSNYAPSYYGRGLAYFYKGDIANAIKDFEIAVKLSPDYYEAWYSKGVCNIKEGNYQEAVADLTKAADLNNESADAYYSRANAYHFMNNDEKALEDYSKAIQTDPDYGLAYYGRAVVHKLAERDELALSDFNKYLDLNGNDDGLLEECQRLIREIKNPDDY